MLINSKAVAAAVPRAHRRRGQRAAGARDARSAGRTVLVEDEPASQVYV